jgi:hypothetical protein
MKKNRKNRREKAKSTHNLMYHESIPKELGKLLYYQDVKLEKVLINEVFKRVAKMFLLMFVSSLSLVFILQFMAGGTYTHLAFGVLLSSGIYMLVMHILSFTRIELGYICSNGFSRYIVAVGGIKQEKIVEYKDIDDIKVSTESTKQLFAPTKDMTTIEAIKDNEVVYKMSYVEHNTKKYSVEKYDNNDHNREFVEELLKKYKEYKANQD